MAMIPEDDAVHGSVVDVSETDRQVEDVLNGRGNGGELTVLGQEMPGAFSELQYLMQMARGNRRDVKVLLLAARRTGELMGKDALYRFPVGGKAVEGPTVDLMEALAQEYGWIWKGVTIDRVDGKKIFLRGVVVDLINGVMTHRPYVSTLSTASGGFAKNEEQRNRWEVMQLQVATSKASRTALEHALPHWFIHEAMNAAKKAASAEVLTNKDGKTISLDQAIAEGLTWLGKKGVTKSDVETLFGSQSELWTISDARELRLLIQDLSQGVVTLAGIKAQVASANGQAAPVEPPKETPSGLAGVVRPPTPPASAEPTDPVRAEIFRMERELGPDAAADLRKKAHIKPELAVDVIPVGFLDGYRRSLLAALP